MNELDNVARLVGIMARLRGPDGCPWDRAQTLDTLQKWLLEETYEVLDAIQSRDVDAHRVELGDLLLQVVFQSQIRSEEGAFGFDDVAAAIADKMERRHPHVFGAVEVTSTAEVRQVWEEVKREEGGRESAIDGIPAALPALSRAERLGEKAAGVGFDWPDVSGVLDKVREEIDELVEAQAPAEIVEEMGDVLFSLVNLCRHLHVDPEAALRGANAKFERRFKRMERRLKAEEGPLSELSLERLEEGWQAAKSEER